MGKNRRADFYFGVDGETLLMQINDMDGLLRLKGLFHKLAEAEQKEIRLSSMIELAMTGFNNLEMSNWYTYTDIRMKNGIVRWGQTPEDWSHWRCPDR